MPKFILYITEPDDSLLKNTEAECFLLDSSLPEDFCRRFVQEAQAQDKLVLAYGDQAEKLCCQYHFDGILLDLSKNENPATEAKKLREKHKNRILGFISRNRRHEAMILSETEPDFLAFRLWQQGADSVKELVNWYNELFLIQSAVFVEEQDIDLTKLEADNLIIKSSWYKDFSCEN